MIYNYLRDYNYYLNFVMDTITHLLVSIYGIYLYKTNQIYSEKKKIVKSISFIYSVVLVMILFNIFLGTSYFGLGLKGNHNIYNVVITKSSILNLIIYIIGLSGVLTFGYLYQIFLKKVIYKES